MQTGRAEERGTRERGAQRPVLRVYEPKKQCGSGIQRFFYRWIRIRDLREFFFSGGANQNFFGLNYLKSLSIDKKISVLVKENVLLLDPGSEIPGGTKNRIRAKHPGCATLQKYECTQRRARPNNRS
jgi:hypothetical protein